MLLAILNLKKKLEKIFFIKYRSLITSMSSIKHTYCFYVTKNFLSILKKLSKITKNLLHFFDLLNIKFQTTSHKCKLTAIMRLVVQ